MEKVIAYLFILFTFLGLIMCLSLLLAWPVMLLWDWLMPAIFGLRIITFWEAWGILTLSGLLFKSSSTSTNK